MSASKDYKRALQKSLEDVCLEVEQAKGIFSAAFVNYHEAHAVIREEFDELWNEVKKKNPDEEKIRTEAKQTAAMCLRLMVELTDSTR